MAFGNYNYNPYAWSNPYAMPQYPAQAAPVVPATPQPTQSGNGIRWVQGEAGAKAYPIAPGESAFLMDSEASMAYLKTMDQNGMPSMRYYSITEVTPDTLQRPEQPHADYATLDDLGKLREEVKNVRKALKTIQAAMEGDSNE